MKLGFFRFEGFITLQIHSSTVIRIEYVYSLVPLMRKPVLQLGSGIQWSLLVILGLVGVVWLSSLLLLQRDVASSSLLSHWQPLDMGLQMMGSSTSARAVTLRERLLFGCVLMVALFYSSNILAQLTNLKLGRKAYMRFETFEELDESGLIPIMHPSMFNSTFKYRNNPTLRRCMHRVNGSCGNHWKSCEVKVKKNCVACIFQRLN
uniref:Ionotropic glutamate receptor C-terminal domain-containing protein n=1 Tax=Trichogramma kaykai TaxID=54128 RepID=A0ABD2XBS3_9HYME